VSGVLGIVAVDSYQFKKSKEASWRLGPADVQTLQDVGEMLGEWLDTYRKAQVLRRVEFALQVGGPSSGTHETTRRQQTLPS
jgi:hypothetical protein